MAWLFPRIAKIPLPHKWKETGKGNLGISDDKIQIFYDKIQSDKISEDHAPCLTIPIIFTALQPRHREKENGYSKLIRIHHCFSNKSV